MPFANYWGMQIWGIAVLVFLFVQIACADTPWTKERFEHSFKGKSESDVFEFLYQGDFVQKQFGVTAEKKDQYATLNSWFAYLKAHPEEADKKYTNQLLGLIWNQNKALSEGVIQAVSENISLENSRSVLESVANFPSQDKLPILEKGFHLLEAQSKQDSASRKFAQDLVFYARNDLDGVLNGKRAVLLLKNGEVSEKILNTAIKEKPFPVDAMISALQIEGEEHVLTGISTTGQLLLELVLKVQEGEVKLTKPQIEELKQIALNSKYLPENRELAYHVLCASSESLGQEIVLELSQRKDKLAEHLLLLDLKRDEPNFDPTSYYSIYKKADERLAKVAKQRLMQFDSDNLPLLIAKDTLGAIKPDDDTSKRRSFYTTAELLGEYIEKHPKSVSKKFEEELTKILSKEAIEEEPSRTALRKYLPTEMKKRVEQKIAKEKLHASNLDPCQVRCRLVEHFAKNWNELKFLPDEYFNKFDQSPWRLAVKSKATELLYLGGKDCGFDYRDQIIDELTKFKIIKETKESTETKLAPKFIADPGQKDVSAFLEQVSSLSKDDLPPSSPFIFAFSHLGQLLNQLKKPSDLRSKTDNWLSKINRRFQDLNGTFLSEGGQSGGSLIGTYHIAVANLGFQDGVDNSDLAKGLELMKNEVKNSIKEYGNPYQVGYSMSSELSQQGKPIVSVLAKSIRGASARMVPFHLALYRHSDPIEKTKQASVLLGALENYLTYFEDNWAGRGEYRTHERYDTDLLAPYFGPSTVSYAFEAMNELLNSTHLNQAQKNQVKNLNEFLSERLLARFKPEGLLKEGHEILYTGAKDYENAFAGIALHQACMIQEQSKAIAGLEPHASPLYDTMHSLR